MTDFLLDCDGVLSDFVAPICARYNKPRELITGWDIPEALEIDSADMWAFVGAPGYCRSLPVVAGAQDFVEQLRGLGSVTIVTSPVASDQWIPERLAWLKEHFGFKTSDVCVWSQKHRISGDVLIDDAAHNMETWPRAGVLVDCPWNQDYVSPALRPGALKTSPNHGRAKSWADVLAFCRAFT
jgi:5'(3')-deoxyribonucleotidase